jgi:tetratricopeptide (TPR) repeat protein
VLRPLFVLAAVALTVWLGAVQLASSAAYGDLAVRPSLPAALHARAPRLLHAALGGPRARAGAALQAGDLAEAQAIVATLPDDPETFDLRGRLAQARGQRDEAIDGYVRAGDVVRAQGLIDELSAVDPARALADQQRLVARLGNNAAAGEVTGQAWWRLGQLQAAAGYRDAARRAEYWRDAETSYERALALGPNEETYLLAAGFQSLANGDVAASQRWYMRAAEVVPNSADAYAGLAWTAAASGDCARALRELSRARALYATTTTTAYRDPAEDAVVGSPLKRCTQ